jgi:hypothetical protein
MRGRAGVEVCGSSRSYDLAPRLARAQRDQQALKAGVLGEAQAATVNKIAAAYTQTGALRRSLGLQ